MSNRTAIGNLFTIQRRNAVGRIEGYEWEWTGGDTVVLSADGLPPERQRLKPNDVVHVGPHRVRVLEVWPWMGGYLVTRESPLAPFRVWRHRLSHLVGLAYRRLVLTAAVWGLADFRDGALADWTDVRCLRRWFPRAARKRRG